MRSASRSWAAALPRGALFGAWHGALLCALIGTPAFAARPAQAQTGGDASAVTRGIVSVAVTSQSFDELLPWLKGPEKTVRGNAVVTATRELLTTADLVKNGNLLEVRKFGRYPDYPARRVWVDYDLNLALLAVDAADFWSDLKALPLAETPVHEGTFAINRWRPNGRFERGTGEVADVLVSNSPYGLMEFPVMRGTTTMGALGWSEVITSDGAVIGLLTSHENQQIQAVNSDLLRLAVEASRRGRLDPSAPGGFAHRGFAWQQLNQEHLRASLGLPRQGTGVLVRRVFDGGTGATELRAGDILHRINGYAIDPEGRIEHPAYGRLLYTIAINESLAPTLPVEIERDGGRRTVELRRARFEPDDYRVPPPRFDGPVDYEVFGGLVLQELSVGYLRAWGGEWRTKAPARLVSEYATHALREPHQPVSRVIVISRVLSDPANLGYEDVANSIVQRVNGRDVRSLADVRAALDAPRAGYHALELLPGSPRAELIFAQAERASVTTRVRERYGIPPRE